MSHPAISVEDLWVRYVSKGGTVVHAVRGLSFEVQAGEVVGFLGPNGAGKSSTLKAIMGFLTPHSGQLFTFGEVGGSLASKRGIGYLPEVALYYPHLTPAETLRIYGELQGIFGGTLKKEIDYLLEVVGIPDARNRQNRTLSKGMLQRVGIAQSLLGNPKLLILDEVTSGLDPIGRKELRTLLKSKREEGATLFFSSHELSEVDMLCDRILLIHEGKLLESHSIQEVKDRLQRFAVTYRGAVSLVDLTDDWTDDGTGAYTAVFGSKESLLAAVERIGTKGGAILDVVSDAGSLEDYFVETIRRAA